MESKAWDNHIPGVWAEVGWLVQVADIWVEVAVVDLLALLEECIVLEPLEVGMVYWA